jgi:hypothetical protein
MIDSFDLSRNFWDVNTGFLTIEVFRSFHKNDKTKKKARSSKTMWAISLLKHVRSKFANLSYDDRLQLINEDFLEGEFELDPEDKHYDLIKTFQKHCTTRIQRIASQWGDKLDERFKFIDEVEYTAETAEFLDKMMANTDKMWKQYITCLKDLESEAASTQVMGGATESLLEQNRI